MIPADIAVLRALRVGGWLVPAEIAEITDLAPWTVRSSLSEMRCRRLVDRGATFPYFGQWAITEHGLQELAVTEQLRLVV